MSDFAHKKIPLPWESVFFQMMAMRMRYVYFSHLDFFLISQKNHEKRRLISFLVLFNVQSC